MLQAADVGVNVLDLIAAVGALTLAGVERDVQSGSLNTLQVMSGRQLVLPACSREVV